MRKIYTIRITPKERKTLLKAMECLIDQEQDTVCHTKLTEKIIGRRR